MFKFIQREIQGYSEKIALSEFDVLCVKLARSRTRKQSSLKTAILQVVWFAISQRLSFCYFQNECVILKIDP